MVEDHFLEAVSQLPCDDLEAQNVASPYEVAVSPLVDHDPSSEGGEFPSVVVAGHQDSVLTVSLALHAENRAGVPAEEVGLASEMEGAVQGFDDPPDPAWEAVCEVTGEMVVAEEVAFVGVGPGTDCLPLASADVEVEEGSALVVGISAPQEDPLLPFPL